MCFKKIRAVLFTILLLRDFLERIGVRGSCNICQRRARDPVADVYVSNNGYVELITAGKSPCSR
jgi:hypothetical protein